MKNPFKKKSLAEDFEAFQEKHGITSYAAVFITAQGMPARLLYNDSTKAGLILALNEQIAHLSIDTKKER